MTVIVKLAKSRIARNTLALMVAELAARALNIFYIAALARYVGAQGLGRISTATALNGLAVLLVGPGLKTLMIRDVAPDTTKAGAYLSNMLFLKGLLGVPFALLTAAVARIAGYPGDILPIVYAYTLVYFIDTLTEIPAAVFQAFERMEYEATAQIVRHSINITFSLLAIYLHWSLLAIVLVSVFAQICRLVFMMAMVYSRFVRPALAINFNMSKTLLISSLPFGVLLILATVQAQLGTFVLSLYHHENVVGLYSAATSLMTMILLLSGAFSSAIFPTLSSLHVYARDDLRRFYQLCYKLLLVVGFPLGLGTILIGDKVILLVYGDEFEGSGAVIKILAIYLFTLVGYSNGPLLSATGRQTFFAWTQALAVLASGMLSFYLVPHWGPVGAATAFVLPGIATFFVHSIACHRQLGLPLPWLTIARVLLATSFMGLVTSMCLWSGVPWLVVVLLVAPSTYGLALLLLGIVKYEELHLLAGAPSSGWTMSKEDPAQLS